MAVKTSVKTGKASEAATWSNGKAVEAGDDIVCANGFNVTWDTAEIPRSVIAESGATFTSVAGKSLKIGASTVREVKAGEVVHLKISSGATWSFTEKLIFQSTSATVGGIWMGGKSLGGKEMSLGESGHYKLEEAVTGEAASEVSVKNTATLETNGQEVAVGGFTAVNTPTVTLGASLVKLSKTSFTVWSMVAGATFSGASSTIELTDTSATFEKTFAGGGKTYGTAVFAGFAKITGANTFSTLKDNTKGAAAGKGLRFEKSVKQTITTFQTSGTEAEPALLESTEAGKPAELEINEQETTGFLHLKDMTVLKGVWYLPSGKDEGGNKIVKPTASFTVAFEKKPSAELNVTFTGKVTFAGTAALKQTQFATATGKAVFQGTTAGRQVQAAALTGRATFQGSATGGQMQGLTAQTQVRFAGTVSPTQRLLLAIKGAVRFAGRVTLLVPAAAKRIPGRFLVWFEEED